MLRRLILLSGPIASGKSTLARQLAESFSMQPFRTRQLLTASVALRGRSGRIDLQREGDRLDRQTKGGWVLDGLNRHLRQSGTPSGVVVDSVRRAEQVEAIRKAYGPIVTHIHLTAPPEVLGSRYGLRRDAEGSNYEAVRKNRTERLVDRLGDIADVLIDTNRCTGEDVLVRAASYLNLYGAAGSGYVDVIVGGQYGSEGKGQIAAFLARDYDLLVRVGGPNAGHKVYEEPTPYTHHQLPSGTRRTTNTHLLIGPGAVLRVEKLLAEIADCGVEGSRLRIDKMP